MSVHTHAGAAPWDGKRPFSQHLPLRCIPVHPQLHTLFFCKIRDPLICPNPRPPNLQCFPSEHWNFLFDPLLVSIDSILSAGWNLSPLQFVLVVSSLFVSE